MRLQSSKRALIVLVVGAFFLGAMGQAAGAGSRKATPKQMVGGLASMNVDTDPGDGRVFNPYRCIADPSFTYTGPDADRFKPGKYYIRIGWATLELVQDQRFLELQSMDRFELRDSIGNQLVTDSWPMGDVSGWSLPRLIPATSFSPDMWVTFTWLPLGELRSGDYYFDLTATINAGSYGSAVNDQGGTPPGPWVSVSNCHLHIDP